MLPRTATDSVDVSGSKSWNLSICWRWCVEIRLCIGSRSIRRRPRYLHRLRAPSSAAKGLPRRLSLSRLTSGLLRPRRQSQFKIQTLRYREIGDSGLLATGRKSRHRCFNRICSSSRYL